MPPCRTQAPAPNCAFALAASLVGPALVAILAAAGPIHAAQVKTIDRGSFTLYSDGVRIGEERFVIEKRPGPAGGVIFARGELDLKLNGRATRLLVALEALTDYTPRRYEAEVDGVESIRIRGVVARERLRLNLRTDRGEEIKQFLADGAWTILEKEVAHHYYFILEFLGEREVVDTRVIVPRDRREFRMTVVDQGRQTTDLGGRRNGQVELRHVTITPYRGATRHVWLDGDRIMKVEIPADSWLAVRSDRT